MRTAIVTVLALLLAPAAGLSGCSSSTPAPAAELVSAADAVDILESTPWLDTVPRSERSVINAYVFQASEGAFFVGNSYKATIEMFNYEATHKSLELEFLDERKSYSTAYTIERYKGEVFDFKLTLKKSPRGPKVYYGFDHDRDGQDLPAVVSKIKGLAGTL